LAKHVGYFAKVGLVGVKSIAKRCESLPREGESGRVEVQANNASTLGGFQNRFAMSAKPNRAINKETSSFRNEELQGLF
jgi:hypothetical protein